MNWLKNLKVGAKIGLGFTLMIVFLLLIGYAGFRSVNTIERDLSDIFEIRLPSVDYLIQADRDLQQLLVAERSMIFANAKSDIFKELTKDYEENLKQADERWKKYTQLSITPKEQEIIPKYEAARNEWKDISKRIVDGRTADTRQGRREALDLTLGLAKEKFEEMRDYLDALTGISLEFAQKAHHNAKSVYQKTIYILLGIIGVGLLVGLVLMWLVNRAVTKPLKAVIEGLTEASTQVASASTEVSTSSQQLAEGSSEQAASLEETSSSLEEMSSMTRQNASNAEQADSLMKEANKVVDQANTSMSQLTVSMQEISSASDETSKIIKTIDEIAFQTNLLALNAAVEAARAGEAGAGFAVVADEVRNLAMRAADAAKNTASLIEATVKKVGDGSELVTKTNDAFSEVASNTVKVGELVAEIAAASKEQAQGIDQVAKAVTEMDKVTQRNAASAEESASASEEMSAQAVQMKGFVGSLEAMVGRGSEHDRAGRRELSGKRERALVAMDTKVGRSVPAPTGAVKDRHSKKEVKPEQVIPLDSENFDDF